MVVSQHSGKIVTFVKHTHKLLNKLIMAFNGTEGAPIELEKAAEWTANYRQTISSDGVKAYFYGKDILNQILTQDGCMGIRIYFAIDGNGQKQMVLVGADANEKDMTNGIVADFGFPCPTHCDTSSALY